MTVMTPATEYPGAPARTLGLPFGRSLTRADLENLPEDGHRYELIDGTLLVSPAPRIRHQDTVFNLAVRLRSACPEDFKVLFAPVDVVLADDTVLEPDVLVAPRTQFSERDLPGPPTLAVEVLSPSTRNIDLLLKKERLRRAGCPNYWIVDVDEPSITAWTLGDAEYREAGRVVVANSLDLTDPFPVSLIPQALVEA